MEGEILQFVMYLEECNCKIKYLPCTCTCIPNLRYQFFTVCEIITSKVKEKDVVWQRQYYFGRPKRHLVEYSWLDGLLFSIPT